MNKVRVLAALMFVAANAAAHAATTIVDSTWCGNVGGAWSSSTCTLSGNTAYTTGFGVTLEIPTGTTLDISASAYVYVDHGAITVDSGGTLDIHSTGASSTGIYVSYGTITNSGTINVDNTGGSTGIRNPFGVSWGTINNSGTINVNTGPSSTGIVNADSITNSGAINVAAQASATGISNNGAIGNSGTITIADGNGDGIQNFGTITNSGTINVDNAGGMGIYNEATSNAIGTISNLGTINIANTGGSGIVNQYGAIIRNSCIGVINGAVSGAPVKGCSTPTVSTQLLPAAVIAVGQSAHDSAWLSGESTPAQGTITFYLYSGSSCSGPGTLVSTVTLPTTGTPLSSPHTFSSEGSYSWQAVYSGDNWNQTATSQCELLTVKALTAIAISPANPTISVGTTTTGTSMQFHATGTYADGSTADVTYQVWWSSSDTSVAGIFGATGGAASNSPGITTISASLVGVTGTTLLTVSKASPTIATVVSNSGTIALGSSASDTATLSGTYWVGAIGSVTFVAYSDSACTVPVFTSTNALWNGKNATSGSFTPASVGTYYWKASYPGDSYNNAVATTCGAGGETLTVSRADQTITFNALADKSFLDPPFTVSATASSGLAVSFSASGQCTVLGATVTITGGGSCTITASQAGDANYNPAPSVSQTFGIANFVATALELSGFSGYTKDTVMVSAELMTSPGGAGVMGQSVSFSLGSLGCTTITAADGVAQCSITLSVNPGTYPLSASFAGTSALGASSATANFTVLSIPTSTTCANAAGQYWDPVTLSANVADAATCNSGSCVAVTGGSVTFTVASQSCTGDVDALGDASCTVTVAEGQGTFTITAAYSGDTDHAASSGNATLAVSPDETKVSYVGPTLIAAGLTVVLSGRLADGFSGAAIPNETLVLSLGAQSCSTPLTDANGIGSCTISGVGSAVGPTTAAVDFGGNAYYVHSSITAPVIVYAFLGSGSFVVADTAAAVGGTVNFWGAHWGSNNTPTGGAAPPSFKGFADSAPQTCGGTWSASPGNSSKPPAIIPEYMAVISSGAIAKSGPTISGDIPKMVVVQVTGSTYGNPVAAPGHDGWGTVIGTICR